MSKYIPKSITEAAKQGFSSPDASWFKGDSIDFVRELLLDKRAPIYDFFDYHANDRLGAATSGWPTERRLLIWSLLNVNQWLK